MVPKFCPPGCPPQSWGCHSPCWQQMPDWFKLPFTEQTKHLLHVSPSFLGVWNSMQPQEHSGLHRPQPSGIPPRTGSRLRLGVGRVLTLMWMCSVWIQDMLDRHLVSRTLQSVCVCAERKSTHFAQDVQDTEPGRQIKLCPE